MASPGIAESSRIEAGSPRVPLAALDGPGLPSGLAAWWSRLETNARFGNVIIVLFLISQLLDGTFTYVGVMTFGRSIEANPLLHWLMGQVGEGTAVTSAKVVAGTCGIALHLSAVHRIVAGLTLLYLGAAIIPWIAVLFFHF